MSRTRPNPHKARHKQLCTPFAGLSAVALLTIASGIGTDGARSKAFFIAGAASSAGAATLRKRSDILSLKEENKQHRDSAAAALQRANSLEEQQRQAAKDVKVIRKIEDIKKQLKQSITEGFEQSTNKQFDAIEITEQILSELQSIKEEVDIGKQFLSGNVKKQLQKLEKEQEKAKHEAAKDKELLRKAEAEKAKHLNRIAELEHCLEKAEASASSASERPQKISNLENELKRQQQVAEKGIQVIKDGVLAIENVSCSIFTAFGMFWSRKAIKWSSNLNLSGTKPNNETLPVNFSQKCAIYILHYEREIKYVGIANRLGEGLRKHITDTKKWNYFSWFSLASSVPSSGTLRRPPSSYNDQEIRSVLAAILIEAWERGDRFKHAECLQNIDPA